MTAVVVATGKDTWRGPHRLPPNLVQRVRVPALLACGLWIGAVARNPLPVALLYLAAEEVWLWAADLRLGCPGRAWSDRWDRIRTSSIWLAPPLLLVYVLRLALGR